MSGILNSFALGTIIALSLSSTAGGDPAPNASAPETAVTFTCDKPAAARTVAPGDSVAIAVCDKPMTDKSGALKGKVLLTETASAPKIYKIDYYARAQDSGLTETVKYIDGGEHDVGVTVADQAPPTLTSVPIFDASFRIVFELFIIATLLESGLAVLFNWRPFVQLFDSRGIKTVVSVGFSYFFVSHFSFDAVSELISVYTRESFASSPVGYFITAMILSGGSSGVNNLMIALGFRSVIQQDPPAPKPKPNEAWIAVRLIRVKAIGAVNVTMGPDGAGPLPIVGTISGSSYRSLLVRYFLRDYGRFPTTGGHAVDPGKNYRIVLQGFDKQGNPFASKEWSGMLASGAVVDIELSL